MDDNNDQVQTDQTDVTQDGSQVQDSDSNTGQSNNQSGQDESTVSKQMFKLPDGREMTADQVYEEYNKLLPEFTRRSQKLSEYEKEATAREKTASEYAKEAVDADQDVLKNVAPEVKDAIVKIVSPVIENAFREREIREQKAAEDRAFLQELETLEKEYDGKNGLPKFDRVKVLEAMQAQGNRVFDPRAMYQKLNEKAINDRLIKQAMKDQSGNRLESTGTGGSDREPDAAKAPNGFKEASERFLSRLANSSE